MRRLRVDLGRVRTLQSRDIPRVFDGRQLHAVAEAEIRYAVLPSEADNPYLPLDARLAESARHQNAVILLQFGHRVRICLVVFRVEPCDFRPHPVRICGELDRFDYRKVSVGEHEIAGVEIFADDADLHCAVAVMRMLDKTFPLGKIGILLRAFPQEAHQYVGELVALEIQGNVVDGIHVGRGNDVVGLHIAPDGELLFSFLVERVRRARDDDVGLNPVGIELADGILGRLRFHLADGIRDRQIGDHEEKYIGRVLEMHDARRIDKKRVGKITERAAYFHDRHVGLCHARGALQALDDLVAHVRNGFYAFSPVSQIAFAFDDRLVDHPAGHVILGAEVAPQEPFVVAHVLIGLETAIENEHFAVLCGVHGTRIHIEIRIYFDEIDREAACREELADGCRRRAFADAGHHAADNKNILMTASGPLLHPVRNRTRNRNGLRTLFC